MSVVVRRESLRRASISVESNPRDFGDVFASDDHLVVLGPLFDADVVMQQLHRHGLEYFEDYFDLADSGGPVPTWCQVLVELRGG